VLVGQVTNDHTKIVLVQKIIGISPRVIFPKICLALGYPNFSSALNARASPSEHRNTIRTGRQTTPLKQLLLLI